MPFARLTVADVDLSEQVQRRLVSDITGLLETDLDKERDVAVCQVNLVPADRWYVGADRTDGATGAHLEVSITAGTNSVDEKAAFLRDAYAAIGQALGQLPAAVYVALYELDGESYGYNGVSQTERKLGNPQQKD